jgi:hypothetical protein
MYGTFPRRLDHGDGFVKGFNAEDCRLHDDVVEDSIAQTDAPERLGRVKVYRPLFPGATLRLASFFDVPTSRPTSPSGHPSHPRSLLMTPDASGGVSERICWFKTSRPTAKRSLQSFAMNGYGQRVPPRSATDYQIRSPEPPGPDHIHQCVGGCRRQESAAIAPRATVEDPCNGSQQHVAPIEGSGLLKWESPKIAAARNSELG